MSWWQDGIRLRQQESRGHFTNRKTRIHTNGAVKSQIVEGINEGILLFSTVKVHPCLYDYTEPIVLELIMALW